MNLRRFLLAGAGVLLVVTVALWGGSITSWLRAPPTAGAPDGWQAQKPEFLALAQQLRDSTNPYQGRGKLDAIRAAVEDPRTERRERVIARSNLAAEHLRFGDEEAALEQIRRALVEARNPTPGLIRLRALAYLRQAEVRNCVKRHNSDCCIFPLKEGAVHVDRGPALAARDAYLAYLKLLPAIPGNAPREAEILAARWLLNIAYMALDEYPEQVPAAYLIPPEVFESEYDIGRFVDVAPRLGVGAVDLAGGVIVDDIDGDGLLDIVSSTSDAQGPLKAWRNAGDGTFEDRSAASRLDDQLGGLNIVGADYDNDGYVDILVLRGGWLLDQGKMRKSLLHNNRDGTFTDVTRAAGVALPEAPTQAAAWADFDNDGWLDLYVCNESRIETGAVQADFPSNLFHSRRDGTFVDVAQEAGVTNDRYCKGVAAGDYDNDGDMDLYLSNLTKNRLYRNDGGLRFTDVAETLAVTEPDDRSFATWFFDYDNDGWLDLWVGGYSGTIAEVVADMLGQENSGGRPRLYRNLGNGGFADVTREMGLDHTWLPMGANFGDLDNDGWLDLYLGTGDPAFESLMPNIALRNDRGLRFQDVTQSAGLGHLQKGHGTAFADIDNDGDQDIYHQLGGFFPADRFANALFRNPGHGRHFLTIELVGVQTQRMAVGARIAVVLETPAGPRTLHRAAGCVSSFGGSPRRQEIGLGDATAIRSVEVYWPTSGLRQVFDDVPLDRFVRITEGAGRIELLSLAKFEMGG
jgi:hypothetical protein